MNNPIESFYNWYRNAIRHPKYRWLVILGTALYLVSPIDLLPDIIPGLGLLDDGVLATLLVAELSSLAMGYLKGRRGVDGEDSVVETEDASVIDVEAS
ncbi:MAG: YkvA family protein [Phormidesmis sp.]